MVRASVVFPQPDSPASATISPGATARSTPSTAWATDPPPEGDVQVPYLEERQVRRGQRVGAHARASSAYEGSWSRHAASCPSPARYSAGSTRSHGWNLAGHRGWNEHPGGMSRGSGGSPPSPEGALRWLASPTRGNASTRARV